MTKEQWDDTPDYEKNEKIATLIGGIFKPCECGFERCKQYSRWHWNPNANPWNYEWQTYYHQKRPDITNECPDFLHSLDAMHEAEKVLTSGQDENMAIGSWYLYMNYPDTKDVGVSCFLD